LSRAQMIRPAHHQSLSRRRRIPSWRERTGTRPGRSLGDVIFPWAIGDVIVRREVLGLGPVPPPSPLPEWHGRPWAGIPVHVVRDTADELVTYIAPGAELGFVDGAWPTADGRHPWHGRGRWEGPVTLMVQRAGEPHAVWHFWTGATREFLCWYVNLQAPFQRSTVGYDTQDFELDIVVFPDGSWTLKDLEVLDDRVAEGRFTSTLVDWIRSVGTELASELDAGRRWWDPAWAKWVPDEAWRDAGLPAAWANAPRNAPPQSSG
jgi:hypothetical protein